MTNIDIAAVLKTSSLKNESEQSKLSVNQSAWKKELESQLYSKQKDMAVSKATDSSEPPSSEVEILRDVPAYFGLLGNDSFSENGISNKPHSLSEGKPVELNSSSITVASTLQKSTEAGFGVSTGQPSILANKNTMQAGSRDIRAGSAVTQPQTTSAADIKPFSVRLLSDGELLIRDYKQGLLNDFRLEKMVSELKKLTNKDIEKVRINGEVVWQVSKKLPADHLIIDLV